MVDKTDRLTRQNDIFAIPFPLMTFSLLFLLRGSRRLLQKTERREEREEEGGEEGSVACREKEKRE